MDSSQSYAIELPFAVLVLHGFEASTRANSTGKASRRTMAKVRSFELSRQFAALAFHVQNESQELEPAISAGLSSIQTSDAAFSGLAAPSFSHRCF